MKIHALILVLICVLALSSPVLAGGKAVAATKALARAPAKALLPLEKALTTYEAMVQLKSVLAVLIEVSKRGPPPNLVPNISGTVLGCAVALAAYFFLVDPPPVFLSPPDDFIDQQFQPPPSFRFPPELEVKPWE
jgi:hypothetical protein